MSPRHEWCLHCPGALRYKIECLRHCLLWQACTGAGSLTGKMAAAGVLNSARVQAAFTRVHQDFTANVLRGGKPNIVKNVREEIERDLTLEEFRHWTALVRLAGILQFHTLSLVSMDVGSSGQRRI